jgi:hypothetical protein
MPANDEPGTNDNGAARAPTQRRGKTTGFPVVALDEAARIIKEAGKYGFEHSTAAFASYMGHSTTNSGAFRQRLAAFRDWKLIAGRGDTVAMTDIARMIAHPTDDDAERRALQTAFMNCTVFWKLYESSAKGPQLAEGPLGGRAVHDFGVAPGSKAKFVQSFVDSASAAGLAELTDDGKVVLRPVAPAAAPEDWPANLAPSNDTSAPQITTHVGRTSSTPGAPSPVVHQVWDIKGGEIVFEIRTNQALPATAFVTVGEVVASLERLASTLSPKQPDTKASEA